MARKVRWCPWRLSVPFDSVNFGHRPAYPVYVGPGCGKMPAMSPPPNRRRLFRTSAYSIHETLLLVLVDAGVLTSLVFSVVLWLRT